MQQANENKELRHASERLCFLCKKQQNDFYQLALVRPASKGRADLANFMIKDPIILRIIHRHLDQMHPRRVQRMLQ